MTRRIRTISGAALIAATAAFGATSVLPPEAVAGSRPAASSSPLAKAREHYNRGDYRAATIELRNALRANPNSVPARLLQAQVYLRMQQGIPAQTEVEAARRAGASKDDTRHLMAEAMVLQRRYADALEEAKADLVPKAHAAEAARVRGAAQMGLRKLDEAKAEFAEAEQLAPRNVQVQLDLARYHAAARDMKSAEAAVDKALSLDPRNTRALVLKGDLVRASQGLEKALPLFNQALQIDPNNMEARLERAATLTDLKRHKEALADLQRIDRAMPDHPLSLYLQAVIKVRERKFEDAESLMARTKGALSKFPPALMLQGVISYQRGNLQQAQSSLRDLMQVAPNHTLARRLYAMTLLRNGDADGAIAAAKPLVEKSEADGRLLALMASAYARKGNYDEAEKYLEQAVAADPEQSALKTQLAMTRVAQGENTAAIRDLEEVLKDDPTSLQALMMAALVKMKEGNFREALLASDRLVKAHPDLAIGYNLRGAAFLGQSKLKEAESNFRAAIQKKPDYHEARRNLAQLLAADGRTADARRELMRALEGDGQNTKTLMALAEVARVEKKPEERVDWLKKAVATNRDTLAPRLRLIQAYLETNRNKEALAETNALSRDFPNNPAALEATGRTQLAAGEAGAAAATFERLTKAVPNDVNARVLYARALQENKRVDAARRAYTLALNLKDQNLTQVYLDLMALEAREGNFKQAIAHGQALKARSPKSGPQSGVADRALGDLYMGNRQWAEAAASYEAARKAQGLDPMLGLSLAQAYAVSKKPDQAMAVLNEVLKTQPKHTAARIALADIHMQAKRYPQALEQYNGLEEEARNSPAVLNNMAWLYGELKDKRAIPTAEAAYKKAPKAPEVQDTLGFLLVQQRVDVKRGLALIQEAVKARPDNPDMRYHLAVALNANGKRAEAQQELENILSKHKSFDSITLAQQTLQQIKAGGR